MRFALIVEQAKQNWAAYVPDVPGLGITAPTLEAVLSAAQEALAFHIEGMLLNQETIPQPQTPITGYAVEVDLEAITQAIAS
ncbi:MAG: type II toxin-antitoxin system HicB family antitoxin [Blastochloris sp.]|nr:type II toxin-antitoxin system HicB family antitoxin [Blastochloris sp.]